MAEITVQEISLTGLDVTEGAAAAGGDNFANDGKTYIQTTNGDAGSHDVTINSKADCDQGFDHDVTVSVAAGATIKIGPFPVKRFSGNVSVSYDDVTMHTVAAVRLPVSI